jgi:Rieske Fe-S protein
MWRWTGGGLIIGGGLLAARVFADADTDEPKVLIGATELARLDAEGSFIHRGYLITGNRAQPRAISLRCSHLGCTVKLDAATKELTCPCHRSRFALDGRPLAGPATEPLAPACVSRQGDDWLISSCS